MLSEDGSNCVIRPIADRPSMRLPMNVSGSLPLGAKTPRPVMTTLRTIQAPEELSVGCGRSALCHGDKVGNILAFEHPRQAVHHLPHALHVLCDRVRNVDLELFLKSEKNVHAVKRIDSQLLKARLQRDGARIEVLLPGDDLNDFLR